MRTFAMIKPDAMANDDMVSVLSIIDTGFRIVGMRIERLTLKQSEYLYEEHQTRSYYEELLGFTMSGPVLLLALEHAANPEDSIKMWRVEMGDTHPNKAYSQTLRHKFGRGVPNNAVHGSADEEAAKRELNYFFGPKAWARTSAQNDVTA